MNLIDFFDGTAARHPARSFMVFEGRQWSYREVAELATRISHGLKAAPAFRRRRSTPR